MMLIGIIRAVTAPLLLLAAGGLLLTLPSFTGRSRHTLTIFHAGISLRGISILFSSQEPKCAY